MSKVIDFVKRNIFLIVVIGLSVFTFSRMLRTGIYSTQDFHLFRLYEFDRCVKDLQIPCRWAPDAGLGYGEPLFNFYGQLPYAIGEVFHLFGFNLINSLKLLFIISLVGAAVGMFLLAKEVWKSDRVAYMSALLYTFAPYRALDVWVRGALPEALSFVFFPLIILSIEKKKFTLFTLLLAGLILTHNLSVVMFTPLLVVWICYRKYWKGFLGIILAILLSSFYVLPVIFESGLIDLLSTTRGYFDFHNHYATLHELFISNFWGYGASVWGPKDDLSLSIGYLQWIIPLLLGLALFIKQKIVKNKTFLILIFVALGYLFLTHNKSTIIWEVFSPLAYVQFPWRFLGVLVFCLSLSVGAIDGLLGRYKNAVLVLFTVSLLYLSVPFFKEDIWYNVGDSHFTQGVEWDRQRSASIGDFWPLGTELPLTPAQSISAQWQLKSSKSNMFIYKVTTQKSGNVVFPVSNFPGWTATSGNGSYKIKTEKTVPGSIIDLPAGEYDVVFRFTDTWPRKAGNVISILSIAGLLFVNISKRWKKYI